MPTGRQNVRIRNHDNGNQRPTIPKNEIETYWRKAMATSPAIPDSRVTLDLIRSKKGHQRITFVTAYDFPTGKLADEAGFDMILVGDTLAEVVLAHEPTLPVTFMAILHHTSAARRAVKRALLVADLPYGTYHASEVEALRYAVRFIKEGGAQAVKLEGCRKRVRLTLRMWCERSRPRCY